MHIRPFAVTLLVASFFLAARAPAALYQFTNLNTPPNPAIYADWPHAISNSGQITGRGVTPSSGGVAFEWNGSGDYLYSLGTLGGNASEGFGVNDQGYVVGYSTRGGTQSGSAFLYDGSMHALQPYAGYNISASVARSISNYHPNAPQYISGYVETAYSTPAGALWTNGSLSVIAGMSIGLGVNDSGQVAGSTSGGSQQKAVLYSNGVTTQLYSGGARAINNNGLVCGYQFDPNSLIGSEWPVLYNHGQITHLTGTGQLNEAEALNDAGDVVGRYQPSSNVDHAFLWKNGTFFDLNNVTNLPAGIVLETAEGINNNGQITGLWQDSQNHFGGYLLTLVPEPGAMVMLGWIACAALIRRQARGRAGSPRVG